MKIPDEVRKCVVFLGARRSDGEYRLMGTAFFVGRPSPDDRASSYLITARHVIEKARDLGLLEIGVRYNWSDGFTRWETTACDEWVFHPSERSVDVAVRPTAIIHGMDHRGLPIDSLLSHVPFDEEEIGIGSEVFITGLFRPHAGRVRNIPIIRLGNIAAMDDERVDMGSRGQMSAYLIEARSIGGLSGSPVFLQVGPTRIEGDAVEFRRVGPFRLLGLVHGHFDVAETKTDRVEERANAEVNVGIAIVVPWYSISEVLNSPGLLQKEKELARFTVTRTFEEEQLEDRKQIALDQAVGQSAQEHMVAVPSDSRGRRAGINRVKPDLPLPEVAPVPRATYGSTIPMLPKPVFPVSDLEE